jgi:plastocyanin
MGGFMRRKATAVRRLVAGACLAALAAAGVAVAQTTSISIGKAGPDPDEVTVAWGETIQIKNTDSVAHGITSSHAELQAGAIAPGGTFTTALTSRTRTYRYRQTGGKSMSGTIAVDVSGSVTLKPRLAVVLYGKSLTVSGHSSLASTPVLLQQKLVGDSRWRTLATLTSGTNGSFSTVVTLSRSGKLRATIAAGLIRSSISGIGIEPRLSIAASTRRTKVGRPVTVRSRLTPAKASPSLTLLSCSARTGRWQPVADARPDSAGVATFRWSAEYGRTYLHVVASTRSVEQGFLPRKSADVVVTGIGTAPQQPIRRHRAC